MKFISDIVIRKLVFASHIMRDSSGKLILTVLESKINGQKEGRPRS